MESSFKRTKQDEEFEAYPSVELLHNRKFTMTLYNPLTFYFSFRSCNRGLLHIVKSVKSEKRREDHYHVCQVI